MLRITTDAQKRDVQDFHNASLDKLDNFCKRVKTEDDRMKILEHARARMLVFVEGLHTRLGQLSPVKLLDEYLAESILKLMITA
jgi:hypothetical protein